MVIFPKEDIKNIAEVRRCRRAVWQATKDQEMIRIEAGLGRIPERVRRLGTRG